MMSKRCFLVLLSVMAVFLLFVNFTKPFSEPNRLFSKTNSLYFHLRKSFQSSIPNISDSTLTTERREIAKPRKWGLVDIRVHFNNSLSMRKSTVQGKHRILWFNMPPWMGSHNFMSKCDYNNCEVTQSRELIRNVSAVIFCVIHPGMGYSPPLSPSQRDPDQVWVFYGLESPFNYHFSEYSSPSWRNTFNWSMTYRMDSDVQESYGTLRTLPQPIEKNFSLIYQQKTKAVAWIVSHCATHSKREHFVRILKKYISVDIYGMCGQRFNTDIATLFKPYKFFLSFENSLCPDYVTEKFFKYFNHDIVQVVRGDVDYDSLLPNDTFINTAKFVDVEALAKYLVDVGSNEEKYVGFLRRKSWYKSYTESFTYGNAMCNLCRKLNDKRTYRNSYADVHQYVQKSRPCIQPSNISDIQQSSTLRPPLGRFKSGLQDHF